MGTSHVPILTGLVDAPKVSLVRPLGPDWIILDKGYDILVVVVVVVVVGCGGS